MPSIESKRDGVPPGKSSDHRKGKRAWWQLASAKIATCFVIWSTVWIVLSDSFLHELFKGTPPSLWTLETVKGLIYVAVTGVLLYLFARAKEREYFAARRTTENRLRRLSESNLISICYWRPEGEITDANDAFLKLLGYTRQELLEKNINWSQLTPPDYLVQHQDALRMLVASGSHVTYEKELLRKDGARVPALVGSAMLDRSNMRGISYLIDTSELKSARERSVELEQQLRQAQKLEAVGQLASGIAHDFNNLLNVIIGYTCLIEAKAKPDDALGEQAKHILKAAEKASGLIRKLLAFGRKQLLNPELLNINNTLREYEPILPRLLGEKVKLELQLSSTLWPVEVDRNQLEQVVINLVVNARDAMPYGGTLTITTENEETTRNVVMKVRDTGTGMNEHTKTRLFDPFFTTKPEGQGTGLGLSTVYGIVSQSGGQIFVSSELGHGTEFSIYLPKSQKGEQGVRAVDTKFKPLNLDAIVSRANETVLLAEDEHDLRELLTSLLRINGYQVLTARDGEEAIVVAKTHEGKIDLLLTDIVMPRMNGIEAAQVIRKLRPNLRTIYMTGYAESAFSMDRSRTNETLLEKPVSPPILFETIREMLDFKTNGKIA